MESAIGTANSNTPQNVYQSGWKHGEALTGIFVYAILPNIIGFLDGGMIGGTAWKAGLPLQIVLLKLLGVADGIREVN